MIENTYKVGDDDNQSERSMFSAEDPEEKERLLDIAIRCVKKIKEHASMKKLQSVRDNDSEASHRSLTATPFAALDSEF